MHQVNLNDELYREARRRAEVAGFPSVDEYVADVLSHDFQLVDENLDHFLYAGAVGGSSTRRRPTRRPATCTMDQAREALARTRDAWLRGSSGK